MDALPATLRILWAVRSTRHEALDAEAACRGEGPDSDERGPRLGSRHLIVIRHHTTVDHALCLKDGA